MAHCIQSGRLFVVSNAFYTKVASANDRLLVSKVGGIGRSSQFILSLKYDEEGFFRERKRGKIIEVGCHGHLIGKAMQCTYEQ